MMLACQGEVFDEIGVCHMPVYGTARFPKGRPNGGEKTPVLCYWHEKVRQGLTRSPEPERAPIGVVDWAKLALAVVSR